MDQVEPRRQREILVFEVGGRRYGLPVTEVRELLRMVSTAPLPMASSLVEGVINLRGVVVPVLDLRARLRLPAKPAEPSDHLVVVEARGRRLALRIDRALDLTTLDSADIDQAGGLLPGREDVAEVAKFADGLVLLLDLRALLSPADSTAIGELPPALAGAGEEDGRP